MTPGKRIRITVILIMAGCISAVFVSIETHPVGYDVAAEGDFVYVSNNDGVVVIDKSVYNAPVRVANVPMSDGAFGLDIENDRLYAAGSSSGLVIVDISIPTSPVILGDVPLGVATNVFVSGNCAYVVNADGELGIVDVSNSSDPLILGTLDVGSRGSDVAVAGNTAYFADPDSGLVVIDVSEPSSPGIIQTLSNTHGAWDICIYEDILYLGCHGNGLRVFNMSSPEDPTWLSSFDNGGEVYGVSGNREYLVLADLQEGAELLDVTDLRNPVLVAEYSNAAPHSVYFDGKYAYLGDQDKEFILIDFDADEPIGYPSRSLNVNLLWAIPIILLSIGVSVIVVPVVGARMKSWRSLGRQLMKILLASLSWPIR